MNRSQGFHLLCGSLACLQVPPHATHDLVGGFLCGVEPDSISGQPDLGKRVMGLFVDRVVDPIVQDQIITFYGLSFFVLECEQHVTKFCEDASLRFPFCNAVPKLVYCGAFMMAAEVAQSL